ncbi:MAG: zincin-like metallopeptidase domain-containing protein [Pseudomonadota bacterium]
MNMNSSASRPRVDVYALVTARIIEQLEQGVRPWCQPWKNGGSGGCRPLRCNGEPYRGINVLMLWAGREAKGYTSPYWLTFKQALELNAHVRKGEHGSMVVYADRITKSQANAEGEEVEEEIRYLKVYTVFNAEQVVGLPERFFVRADDARPAAARIEEAEAFAAATKAEIHQGGNAAYYAPGADRIQMPPLAAFRDAQAYYATLLHELTHWTGSASRLAREFGRRRSGDAEYAREELVAEIGAAFLCADLGIALEPRADHADYLGHWLGVLTEDKRAIFQAAAHAQRAAGFLHRLQESEQRAA